MHRRENFTAYETMPEDLAIYLSHYGPHFTKELCEFAVSKMYKEGANGKKEYIKPYTKAQVDEILQAYDVKLEYAQLHDATYVANMCKADYLGSSIVDEAHLAKYIKDTIDDPDAIDGFVFNRWIGDMKWLGVAIPWYDFV